MFVPKLSSMMFCVSGRFLGRCNFSFQLSSVALCPVWDDVYVLGKVAKPRTKARVGPYEC